MPRDVPREEPRDVRGTRSHIIGEVGDDEPRDEPRDVPRHPDARRGRSSRRRAAQ
jgi:hypothetical protein